MGVLSDFIIAKRDEASAIKAAHGGHLKKWDCLESKGIDTIKLGTLSAILSGTPLDDINSISSFMLDAELDKGTTEEEWVFLVPDQLVAALATTDEKQEKSIAFKWAATEEFQMAGWQSADVEEYLHRLVIHAKKSRLLGKDLLLWMSL